MDSSADGSGSAGSGSRADSGLAGAGRDFRAGVADQVSGDETIFAGRRGSITAAAGFDFRSGGEPGGGTGGGGDEPSRTLERDGAHRGPQRSGSFRAF